MREALVIADAILAAHVIVIAFNAVGLVLIPVGAWRGWRIVRTAWLRLLHLVLLAVVAGQALAGRACLLTIWQQDLVNGHRAVQPLIMHWVDSLIYWNLPMWVFQILYTTVFLYVIALTVFVPFRARPASGG